MKIAFLIQDISTDGGTERTTCCLAEEMVRRGHTVSIVSVFHNQATPRYQAEGAHCIFLTEQSYTLRENTLNRFLRARRTVSAVRTCKALQEADVILCQKIAASYMAWQAGFAAKAIACEHYRYGMYNSSIRWLRKKLYSRMRAVVTLTENDRASFMREGLHEVYCVPNMVSIRPLPYQGKNSRRIVSVGRLTWQKGYDLLLQAIAMIADEMGDYYVEIYGDGEDRKQLETQSLQLGIDQRVHFCGYTSSIEQVYADSAIYILSSRFEGFPMVLLEAAAAGVPIVSFDCPEGAGVLLRNGGGLLVEPENVAALSQALLRMIREPELREQCHNSTSRIIAPYSPEKIGERWESLLRNLIKQQI